MSITGRHGCIVAAATPGHVSERPRTRDHRHRVGARQSEWGERARCPLRPRPREATDSAQTGFSRSATIAARLAAPLTTSTLSSWRTTRPRRARIDVRRRDSRRREASHNARGRLVAPRRTSGRQRHPVTARWLCSVKRSRGRGTVGHPVLAADFRPPPVEGNEASYVRRGRNRLTWWRPRGRSVADGRVHRRRPEWVAASESPAWLHPAQVPSLTRSKKACSAAR